MLQKTGFLAFVNQPLFHEDGEGAQDLRFVGRVERQIRLLPIAEHAEPLELLALDIDELARERFAASCRTSSGARPRDSFTTLYSIGRPWQSQPGTIRRAKAGHRFRFHDQVLQDLVQRRAHVHVAVGERRAIVQDEQLRALRAPSGFARKAASPPTLSAISGSRVARFAFIGKSVFGRLSVSL